MTTLIHDEDLLDQLSMEVIFTATRVTVENTKLDFIKDLLKQYAEITHRQTEIYTSSFIKLNSLTPTN